LEQLLQNPLPVAGPRVLVLVPTRELARQVFKDALQLVRFADLRLASIAGGESYAEQLQRLNKAPALLVATPGRLLRVLAEEDLNLESVELLVLDEADRMLDMGFAKDIQDTLAFMPSKPRILLFSATLGEYRVANFASQVLQEPQRLVVGQDRSLPPHIEQLALFADSLEHKFQLLAALLGQDAAEAGRLATCRTWSVESEHRPQRAQFLPDLQPNSPAIGQKYGEKWAAAVDVQPTTSKSDRLLTLVFGFSRERCQRIQSWLLSQGLVSQTLHGELAQKDRNRITYRFIQGEIPILVVTDLAARGLHLPSVTRVIHFDLPRSAEIYLHRAGRAGRNGQPGETLLLVEAHDAQLLGRIERYQRLAIKRGLLPGLEPRHREPVFSRKKKMPKLEAKQADKPRIKERWRNTKNKGKPKPKPTPVS
jgi:ATP-dependent RNA helicase SrmB